MELGELNFWLKLKEDEMEGLFIVIVTAILAYLAPHESSEIILLKNSKDHNAIVINTDKGSVVVDKPYMKVSLIDRKTPPSKPKRVSKEKIEKKFSDTLKLLPQKPLSIILYFKSGSYELTEESKNKLKSILKLIKKRSPCLVDIIGHTDTVGSWESNVALSLKRAKFIKNILIKNGADPSLLTAKGYGESELLVKTPDEVSEPKNRNVEIFIK